MTFNDLEKIDRGLLFDLITENVNDGEKYAYVADQKDFDAF